MVSLTYNKNHIEHTIHRSIVVTKNLKSASLFSFLVVFVDDFTKQIRKLNPRNATEDTDVPFKILK